MSTEITWVYQAMKYLSEELSAADFEKYVNETKSIETEMEPDDYLELISRNYLKQNYRKELSHLVRKYLGENSTEVAEIQSMLRRIVKGLGDPADIICALYNKMGRHTFVYDLAIHTVMGVDDLPRISEKKNWESKEFEKARKWFEETLPYYKRIAQTILDSFDNGNLIIKDNDVIQSDKYKGAGHE